MITTNTIFNLSTPVALNNLPQHFNPQLSLWEHLLNQHYPLNIIHELIDLIGAEEGITQLIQNLIDLDEIYIIHPETGEIIWEL